MKIHILLLSMCCYTVPSHNNRYIHDFIQPTTLARICEYSPVQWRNKPTLSMMNVCFFQAATGRPMRWCCASTACTSRLCVDPARCHDQASGTQWVATNGVYELLFGSRLTPALQHCPPDFIQINISFHEITGSNCACLLALQHIQYLLDFCFFHVILFHVLTVD